MTRLIEVAHEKLKQAEANLAAIDKAMGELKMNKDQAQQEFEYHKEVYEMLRAKRAEKHEEEDRPFRRELGVSDREHEAEERGYRPPVNLTDMWDTAEDSKKKHFLLKKPQFAKLKTYARRWFRNHPSVTETGNSKYKYRAVVSHEDYQKAMEAFIENELGVSIPKGNRTIEATFHNWTKGGSGFYSEGKFKCYQFSSKTDNTQAKEQA